MQKSLLEHATPAQEGARREGSVTMPKEKASKVHANPKTLFNVLPDSEVEAYGFIRERLRALGWAVKNPSSGTGGQVWTQNQCFAHEELKQALGLKRPENIVKMSEQYLWVIEAKASRKQLDKAVEEAVNYYAKPINENPNGKLKAVLATGIAGSEETSYLIRSKIRVEGDWHVVTINGQEATGLLSPTDVQFLLNSGGSDIHEFAPPQRVFLEAAEKINELLHTGGINKNDRAKTIAALLLSVVEDPSPNLNTQLPVLIAEINARSEAVLKDNDKPEFAPFVKILAPTNTTNHVKFRTALVRTILELQDLNIRSAMNSSTDVLGKFYEVFLKYGNGAKEIGIVLTPRHITRFAVEAIGASHRDIVLDPACGTGGFLVAAFDHVRNACTPAQLDHFKQHNLFGIEQESYVAILAIVNMIFRGDGKHNITEGNCFSTFLTSRSINGHPSAAFVKTQPKPGQEPVTRVLMNPPFALKSGLDKEYRFVSRALSFMADGGLLFSLLPLDAMFGSRDEKIWRANELLKHNTLLSVMSLPEELFYPAAAKQVLGIIVKKGIPHQQDHPVFWARISKDGHLKLKSRRLPASEMEPARKELDEIPLVLPALQNFVAHPHKVTVNIPMLCKTAPIDFDDPLLELLPEAYIESKHFTEDAVRHAMDDLAREMACCLIRHRKENSVGALDAKN
jgi:type I restriction enzyme M protein